MRNVAVLFLMSLVTVRVKTHPKSDALANFRAKLAPLYSSPYCATHVLPEGNYRLAKLDTGVDAGVFHLLPFHTLDLSSSHAWSETQVGTGTPYNALGDCQLDTQMGEDQPQDIDTPLPKGTVFDDDDFTDNDMTRDEL